jgi:hypothetical protein
MHLFSLILTINKKIETIESVCRVQIFLKSILNLSKNILLTKKKESKHALLLQRLYTQTFGARLCSVSANFMGFYYDL